MKTLSSTDVFKDMKSVSNDNAMFMFANYGANAVMISSHDGGATISSEQIMSSAFSSLTSEVRNFDAAMINNSLSFLWVGTGNLVKYTRSDDSGSSWSPESIINQYTGEVSSNFVYVPKIGTLNGIIYTFWFSTPDGSDLSGMSGEVVSGNIVLKYNRSLSGTSDFTSESIAVTVKPPKDLTGNVILSEFSVVPSINRLMCYYLDSSSGKNEIWMSRFSRLSSSETELTSEITKRITITSANVCEVKAVAHNNLVHVFYTLLNSSGDYDLWYKKSLDVNGDSYETDRRLVTGILDFEASTLQENLYVTVLDRNYLIKISTTKDSGNSFSEFYSLALSAKGAPRIHQNRFGFILPHLSKAGTSLMILKGSEDSVAPTLKSIALTDSDRLEMIFDDDLDQDYFQQTSSFTINNGYVRVFSKELTQDAVVLEIDSISENSQNLLKGFNLKDDALNETASISSNFNGPASYPTSLYYATATMLSSSVYTNNFPSSTTYGQTTYIFYNESVQLATTGNLVMKYTGNSGSSFSTGTGLTSANLYTYNSPFFGEFVKSRPLIINGKIYFLYIEDGTYDVILKKFDISGTLEATVTVASADAVYFLPELSASANYLHCLYRGTDSAAAPGTVSLYYKGISISDHSLSAEKLVASSTGATLNLPVFAHLASDSNYVYIVYSRFNDNDSNLEVSSSDTSTIHFIRGGNEGVTWSSASAFTAPKYTSIHPWISLNGSEVTVSFIDCDDFLNANLYRYVSSDSGMNFSSAPEFIASLFYSRLKEKQSRLYSVHFLSGKTCYDFGDSRGNGTVNMYFNDPSQNHNILYRLSSDSQINCSPWTGKFYDNNGFILVSSRNTYDGKGSVNIYFQDKVSPNYTGYSIVNANTLRIDFSEELDPSTALLTGNYAMTSDIRIAGAAFTSENRSVTLTLSPALTPNSLYTLSIEGVKDKSLNQISTVTTNIQTPSDFSGTGSSGLSGWISEYRLTFDSNNSDPSVSVINQYLLLAYTRNSSSIDRVYTRRYAFADKTWESPVGLTPQLSYSNSSAVSASGSYGAVLYQGKNSSSSAQNYFSITDNQGLSFSTPYSLSNAGDFSADYVSSRLYSAYSTIVGDKYNIQFRLFSTYGTIPETVYQVNPQSLYHSYKPGIVFFNGQMHVVWEEAAAKRLVQYSKSSESPVSFSSPSTLSSGDYDHTMPLLTVLDDKLFLFYLRKTGAASNELYVRTSEDDGASWTYEDRIDVACVNIVSYDVTSDASSGRIHLVYSGMKSGESRNHIYYKYSANGVNWAVDSTVSSTGSDSQNPVIVQKNGKLYIFYDDDRNGSREIYYRTNDTVEFYPPDIELYTFPNPAKTDEIIALIKTETNLLVTPELKVSSGNSVTSVSVSKIKSDTYMGNFNLSQAADNFVKVTSIATSPYNSYLTAESVSYISKLQIHGKSVALKNNEFEIVGEAKIDSDILLFTNRETASTKPGISEQSISLFPDNCTVKNPRILFSSNRKAYLVSVRNGEEQFVMSEKRGCLEISGGKYYIRQDATDPVINNVEESSEVIRTVNVQVTEYESGVDIISSNISVNNNRYYPVSDYFDHSKGEYLLKFNLPKSLYGEGKIEIFDHVGNSSDKAYSFKAAESAILEFYVYPNPVTSISDIPIVVSTGNEVAAGEIKIFDFRGDLVTKFPFDQVDLFSQDSGLYTYRIIWQGINKSGRKLSNGTFLMKASARFVDGQDSERTFKLTVME